MYSVTKNIVMSIISDFILIVVKVKQDSECSQRFSFNNSKVKERSECSQRFHFNSSDSKTAS